MKSLLIVSDTGYSGKSLVCACFGKLLQQKGKRVGYFKPYGTLPCLVCSCIVDDDAAFLKQYLSLDEELADICPVVMTHEEHLKMYRGQVEGIKEKIMEAFEKVSRDKDVVLIGGGRAVEEGKGMGFSTLDLALETGSGVVLIDRFEETRGLDGMISWKDRLGDCFRGLILNRVDPDNLDFLKEHVVPFLESKGVPVLGVMPQDEILAAVSVADLAVAIGGRVCTASDRQDMLVHRFVVGAMTLESASRYFRNKHKKAVITGGDRVDLQVAALDTSTRCLVLTGGIAPHPTIMSKAEELKIPIIVVSDDTLTTVGKIDVLIGRPRMKEPEKMERAMKLFQSGVDMKRTGL